MKPDTGQETIRSFPTQRSTGSCGTLQPRACYTKSLGDKRHWKFKPEREWVLTEVEPIVSPELWQRCNHVLDEQEKIGKRISKKTVQLFAGYAVCACGANMYVLSNYPNKYVCRKCRNKIPIGDLEAVYLEQLKGFFMSPKDIEEYLNGAEETIKDKVELYQAMEREYQKVQKDMDETYQLYLDKGITSEGFGKRYLPWEARQKQLKEEMPRVQAEIDFLKINYLSSDEILNEGKGLYESWPTLDDEGKRKIIESITESIVIGKDEIEVNLTDLPSSKKVVKEQQKHIHAVTNPIHRESVFKYTTNITTYKNHAKILEFCPDESETFGQYLKKTRLERHLFAKDLGLQIGCDKNTIWLWERDLEIPRLNYLRALNKIIDFPNYILQEAIVKAHSQITSFKSLLFNFEIIHRRLNSALSGNVISDPSFPKLFLVWRLSHLVTVREFAKILGFDPCSITSWENGEHQPQLPTIRKLRALLASSNQFNKKPERLLI